MTIVRDLFLGASLLECADHGDVDDNGEVEVTDAIRLLGYLYRGGRDTMYRIHGTTNPETIGSSVSNGCIRLRNEDVMALYENVAIGTHVTVV